MKTTARIAIPAVMLLLSACGGGSSSDKLIPIITAPVTEAGTLFIADAGNRVLARLNTLTPIAGDSINAGVLSSSENYSMGIAYDVARNRLYASTGTQFAVFDNASNLRGNITPGRLITPLAEGGGLYYNLQFDKGNDRLYAAYTRARGVNLAVFDNASNLAGNAPATRTVSGITDAYAVDTTRNILYTIRLSGGMASIQAVPDINRLNGALPNVTPQIVPMAGSDVHAIAIDTTRDRLYLALRGAGLGVINNASTVLRAGAAPGSASAALVSFPVDAARGAVSVDAAKDRVYFSQDNTVYVLRNASTLNGGADSGTVKITTPVGSQFTGFAY
ncbi:MAG: hypothetical protein ABW202_05220 [Duganella sp.]